MLIRGRRSAATTGHFTKIRAQSFVAKSICLQCGRATDPAGSISANMRDEQVEVKPH